MRRIIFLIVVLLVLGGMGYVVWGLMSDTDEMAISIVMLETPQDSQKKNLVEHIINDIGKTKRDIKIRTFIINEGWSPAIEVDKPKGLGSDSVWSTKLKSAIANSLNLRSNGALKDGEVSRSIEFLLQAAVEHSQKDGKSLIVLAGLFPECYGDQSALPVVRQVEEKLKKVRDGNSVFLAWYVEGTRKSEKQIFDALDKKLEVVDKGVPTTVERICGKNNESNSTRKLHNLTLLSALDPMEARAWAAKIAGNLRTTVSIGDTLFFDSKSLIKQIPIETTDSIAIYNVLYPYFLEVDSADKTSAKFMFQQLFSKIARQEMSGHVYLLGSIPYKEERLLDPKLLKNLEHIHFTIKIRSRGKDSTAIQEALVNVLRYHNPNIQVTAY